MMFAYEVKSLSGYSDNEVEIDVGVMSASSMADAAKIIENYYEDLLFFLIVQFYSLLTLYLSICHLMFLQMFQPKIKRQLQ